MLQASRRHGTAPWPSQTLQPRSIHAPSRFPHAGRSGPADDRLTFAHTAVGDGEPVQAAGFGFEVLSVPGHTLSHVAFHGAGIVFCGDTLFGAGCGRLFEGTPAQMSASLASIGTDFAYFS